MKDKSRNIWIMPMMIITSWFVFSKISNQPDSFDWFMAIGWFLILLFFLLDWGMKKAKSQPLNITKVSKKAYRYKQNQATGQLLMAILSIVMISLKVHQYVSNGVDLEWFDFWWVLIFLISVPSWLYREKKLKLLEVDEASN